MEELKQGSPIYGTLDHNKSLPDNYKMGRAVGLELAKIERNLFTDIEERESGNFVIRGIERKVDPYHFHAFAFAMAKILYNQSYQSGNEETNSGVQQKKANKLSNTRGVDCYTGTVVVSLNDICRAAYGTQQPDTQQRNAMAKLIETLDKKENNVHISYPNGDTYEAKLCATMGKYTRKEDGAILYELCLHPIFCEAVNNNFALFPQNTIERLARTTKRQTAAHLHLLRLLGMQDKRKPYSRYFTDLIRDMGLDEAYKINTARTEKQAQHIFEDMKGVGIITDYTVVYITKRNHQRIEKVTFSLNSDFNKAGQSQ